MGLLKRFIRNDLADLHASNVRVRIIGLRRNLAADLQALLNEAEDLTRDNDGLTLIVAFNYGARQEIVEAARKLALDVAAGRLDAARHRSGGVWRAAGHRRHSRSRSLIRTSGEQRLSNFLLWQAAYAELVFLPMHWPDFDHAAFQFALDAICLARAPFWRRGAGGDRQIGLVSGRDGRSRTRTEPSERLAAASRIGAASSAPICPPGSARRSC